MDRYDIVVMGHLAKTTVVPFEEPTYINRGGPVFFCSIAASCLTKRIAVVTKMDKSKEERMALLKTAGIDYYLQPGDPYYVRLINPSAKIDERQAFFEKRSDYFSIEDLPPIEPCLIHLVGVAGDGYEFPLEFVQALKARGFRLSVDVQSFIWQADNQTQVLSPKDIPEKQDILRMGDFVKLDVNEAKALTGTDDIEKQAEILENWGSIETLITSSDGALVRSKGKNHFEKFTNRNILGRAGRGDTFTGAYLSRRLDHSTEDSLRYAVALTSIKMECSGPFQGTLEDVLERMKQNEVLVSQ